MALLVHVSDTLCINPTSPLKSCSLLQYSVMTGFIQNNSSQTLLETQVCGHKTHTKWHSTLLSTRYTESPKASEIIQVSLHTSAFLPLSQLVIKITIPWCVSCLRDKTDGVVLTYTSLHCEEQWPRLPSTTERNDHGSDRHKQYCRPQDSGKRSLDLIWGLQRLNVMWATVKPTKQLHSVFHSPTILIRHIFKTHHTVGWTAVSVGTGSF